MKTITLLFALLLSFQSNASSMREFCALPTMASAITSGIAPQKLAALVIDDVNEFHASGFISVSLQTHIESLKSQEGLSELEAIDLLSKLAEDIVTTK